MTKIDHGELMGLRKKAVAMIAGFSIGAVLALLTC